MKKQIETSDLYWAAFLITQNCELVETIDHAGRINFVIEGFGIDDIREIYDDPMLESAERENVNVREYVDTVHTLKQYFK